MNHVELIISAFQVKDLKRNYFPNFQAGRYAIENLLKDKNAKISKKEVKDIVNIARNDWYFTHQIIDNLTKILSGNKKINEEVATALVKEAISTDKNLLSQVRHSIAEWVSIKNGSKNLIHINNIFKFGDLIFSTKEDFVSFIFTRSTKSVKMFASLASLYSYHLSEKEVQLVRSRIKKIIQKLSVNNRNASLLSKALCNPEICEWIAEDSSLKSDLIKFFAKFSAKDIQAYQMILGKNILGIYKGNTEELQKVQDILVELICCSYRRYEKKILQILEIDGTSPRKAFITLIKCDKEASFLCNKFPELAKLQILI